MTKKLIQKIEFNIFDSKEVDLNPVTNAKRQKRVKDEYDLDDDFIDPTPTNIAQQNNLVDCDIKNFFVYEGKLGDKEKKTRQARRDVYIMEYGDRIDKSRDDSEIFLLNLLLNNDVDFDEEKIRGLESLKVAVQDELAVMEGKFKELEFMDKDEQVRLGSDVGYVELISNFQYMTIDLLAIEQLMGGNSIPGLHKLIKMAWSRVHSLLPANIDIQNLHKRVQRFRAIKFETKNVKNEVKRNIKNENIKNEIGVENLNFENVKNDQKDKNVKNNQKDKNVSNFQKDKNVSNFQKDKNDQNDTNDQNHQNDTNDQNDV
ncbi:hypothetical protein EQH57_0145, partial [Dictyocoela roeselum]